MDKDKRTHSKPKKNTPMQENRDCFKGEICLLSAHSSVIPGHHSRCLVGCGWSCMLITETSCYNAQNIITSALQNVPYKTHYVSLKVIVGTNIDHVNIRKARIICTLDWVSCFKWAEYEEVLLIITLQRQCEGFNCYKIFNKTNALKPITVNQLANTRMFCVVRGVCELKFKIHPFIAH